MPNLHKYPFLRLLIPFVLGIWMTLQWPHFLSNQLVWALLILALILAVASRIMASSYALRWTFGLSISIFFFVFGSLYTNQRTASNNTHHLLNKEETYQFYLARIAEPPQLRETNIKIIAELELVGDSGTFTQSEAMIIMYVERNPMWDSLQYGERILFTKAPEIVPGPKNPNQFNYKQHLASKGIYHQVFLRDGDWQFAGQGYANPFYSLAYRMRDHLLTTLEIHGLKGDEFAVASAILLGYDDHLPPYLRKGYAAAGAMHVLCVSGLHVGIIFILLNFLLGFLNKGRKQQIIKTLLLMAAIWCYAMLTGLAPSVNRASVMISFVLLAKLFNRKGNIINSLSASALLLLLFNPFTLLHIGFQLSYSAVLGIVLFQGPIHNLIFIRNKHLDTVWEITALSFAAQLGTTPLAVYYFNQFPVYFWLSNLFLVPLSFAVIVAGMSLLMLSFVPLLSTWLGLLTSGLLFLLNVIIQWVEGLPMSTLQGLYLNPPETLLLYVFIATLLLMIHYRPKPILIPSLLVLLVLFSSFAWRTIENNNAHKFIIYSVPNQRIYGFVHGRDHVLLTDSSTMQNNFVTGFNLEGYWTKAGLTKKPLFFGLEDEVADHPFVYKKAHIIGFGACQIALWSENSPCQAETDISYEVDLLIVTGNVRENIQDLLGCYHFKLLAIDPSVPQWHVQKWQQALLQHSIPFINVREEGAFVWNLKSPLNQQFTKIFIP